MSPVTGRAGHMVVRLLVMTPRLSAQVLPWQKALAEHAGARLPDASRRQPAAALRRA